MICFTRVGCLQRFFPLAMVVDRFRSLEMQRHNALSQTNLTLEITE